MAFIEQNYPNGVNNDEKRIAFLIHQRKKAIEIFNAVGAWYDPGKPAITPAEYAALPAKVRARFPEVPKLASADWTYFQRTMFRAGVWHDLEVERDRLDSIAKANPTWADADPFELSTVT